MCSQGAVQAGGYLTAADDVVQAFHLPKYQHLVAEFSTDNPSSSSSSRTERNGMSMPAKKSLDETPIMMGCEPEQDVEMEVVDINNPSVQLKGVLPLTMRELASVAGQQALDGTVGSSANGKPLNSSYTQAEDRGNIPSRALIFPADASIGDDVTRGAKTTTNSRTSTRKRAREENGTPSQEATPKRGKPVGTAPTLTPSRVLRPRAAKTAAQIQEEKERERAYKKATEE